MEKFETKKKQQEQQEIFFATENPRLDEEIPISVIKPPIKLVAIVKPKKVKSPYIETVLLFLCAIISIGSDAFLFSSSLFGEIFGKVNNTFTTIVAVVCLLVHIVPEVFWGVKIYKKFIMVSNFTVILTEDSIIATGTSGNTECQIIKLMDLVDVKVRKNNVSVITPNTKLTISLQDPWLFVDTVKQVYNNL